MVGVNAHFTKVNPFLMLLFCFWACAEKGSEEGTAKYSNLTFTMDTVLVDSRDEILMAATSPYSHSVSKDLKTLFYWDFQGSQIEVIDLEKMALVEKIPLEKEGPDGVGQNGYLMFLLENGNRAFLGWDNRIAIADTEGNIIKRIKLDEPWMTEGIEDLGTLSFIGFSENGSKIYCNFSNYEKLQAKVLELDIEQEKRRLIEIPYFEKMDKFRVSWTSDNGSTRSMTYPSLSISSWKDEYLFTTNVLNSIYRFDPREEEAILIKYENTLTSSEKTGTYKNEVASQSEIQEVSAKIREEINFLVPIWDEKNEVFYRFSYYTLPRIADESIKSRTFLSILNTDFELIGEKEVTDLGLTVSHAQFVKDGQIYFYLNLEDELAYIRLTIN